MYVYIHNIVVNIKILVIIVDKSNDRRRQGEVFLILKNLKINNNKKLLLAAFYNLIYQHIYKQIFRKLPFPKFVFQASANNSLYIFKYRIFFFSFRIQRYGFF